MSLTRSAATKRAVSACAALFTGIALVAVPSAQAQTIFADNFNAEGNAFNYTGFANWNVNWGSVDVVGFYVGFGQSVDMDGSTGAAGLLVTKTILVLDPGTYTLSFALGKNGGAAESMTVRVGSAFSQTFADALTYPTPVNQVLNFNIVSGTTGTISFDHAGGDNGGFVIDNVSLVRNAITAAPEPGSLGLLLPVLGAVGMLLRRRK